MNIVKGAKSVLHPRSMYDHNKKQELSKIEDLRF